MLSYLKRMLSASSLDRSPEHANNLIDDQILSDLNLISSTFKQSGMMEEIAEQRIKIKKEQEKFIQKFENGDFSENLDEAESIVDRLAAKYKELEIKIDELNEVRSDIVAFDKRSLSKGKELKKEMEKLQERSWHDLERGYF